MTIAEKIDHIEKQTKFIVTEVREHVLHDIHTIEAFVARYFGDSPVPQAVKIEIVKAEEPAKPAPAKPAAKVEAPATKVVLGADVATDDGHPPKPTA